MEKENKYYTPSIDEFHVGFKYQELDSNDVWVDKVFYSLLLDFNINYVRVKYLDKEDIESLGFKYVKNNENIFSGDGKSILFKYNVDQYSKYELLMFEKNNQVWINLVHEPTKMVIPYFKGIIKNKSELKKLMKQLNIQ
jgi:hypothetical protein